MQPPPPRPRGVTFVALVCGFLGAILMAPSLAAIAPTRALFPGLLGGALAVSLIAANVALVAGAVGLWWMQRWGRDTAFAGLVLRAVHDAAFAFNPANAGVRGPYLFGVVVYVLLTTVLVRQARTFVR